MFMLLELLISAVSFWFLERQKDVSWMRVCEVSLFALM